MRISDWSSDVCSSDLRNHADVDRGGAGRTRHAPLPVDQREAAIGAEIAQIDGRDAGIPSPDIAAEVLVGAERRIEFERLDRTDTAQVDRLLHVGNTDRKSTRLNSSH